MNTFAASVLAGALLSVASLANAATTIDATGFSLAWTEGVSIHPFDMTLLSDANGVARIGIDTGLTPYTWDTTLYGNGSNGDIVQHVLAGAVQQGYRITSMTLSAVVNGALYLESWPCSGCVTLPGAVANGASLNWSVGQNGQQAVLPGIGAENVSGAQAIAATAAQSLEGGFELGLHAFDSVSATGTYQIISGSDWSMERWLQASSAISLTDVVLTVQVSAVPEPATVTMLLAGLGVAGWAARRRQR